MEEFKEHGFKDINPDLETGAMLAQANTIDPEEDRPFIREKKVGNTTFYTNIDFFDVSVDPKKGTLKNVELNFTRFREFLYSRGYVKCFFDGALISDALRLTDGTLNGGIVEVTSGEKIRGDIGEYISKAPEVLGEIKYVNEDLIEDIFEIKKSSILESWYRNMLLKWMPDKNTEILMDMDIDVHRDTKREMFFYFKDFVLEVSKNKISEIKYSDLNGVVWASSVNPNRIEINQDSEYVKSGKFRTSLWRMCGEQPDRFKAAKTMIGYALHRHKSPSKGKFAGIISDENSTDDHQNGGSGKSLILAAVKQLRNVLDLPGRSKKFLEGEFVFDEYEPDTDIVHYDDVYQGWDLGDITTELTGVFKVKKKYKGTMTIPFRKSPKFFVTTNFSICNAGSTKRRRRKDLELVNYYSDELEVADEWGWDFFTEEFPDEEWSKFFMFMVQCAQEYLAEGGIYEANFERLKDKQIVKNTCQHFVDWMELGDSVPLQLGKEYTSSELNRMFSLHLTTVSSATQEEQSKDYTRIMSRWVEEYARHTKLKFNRIHKGRNRYTLVVTEKQHKKQGEQA